MLVHHVTKFDVNQILFTMLNVLILASQVAYMLTQIDGKGFLVAADNIHFRQ